MPDKHLAFLRNETKLLQQAGLLRQEPVNRAPTEATISIHSQRLVNLASDNYLGFANHSAVKLGAQTAIEKLGVGTASPRPQAGTHDLHTQLERAVSRFLGTDDTLLFPSRYHANTGLFESIVNENDFVFCDALCHPSVADGLRLCRARLLLYRNNDLRHLEDRLRRSRTARFRVIVTDTVFAVNGVIADLRGICRLAKKYDAMVVVDDSQGIGVLGHGGRGAASQLGVAGDVDVITCSCSCALGGGGGGFASGRQEIISWLRQKSRPYLVSSAMSTGAVGAALRAIELLEEDPTPLAHLRENTQKVRDKLAKLELDVIDSTHPMVVVRVGEVHTTQRLVDTLHRRGFYAVGLCYPVVPEGEGRVRIKVSALHTREALNNMFDAFEAFVADRW